MCVYARCRVCVRARVCACVRACVCVCVCVCVSVDMYVFLSSICASSVKRKGAKSDLCLEFLPSASSFTATS